MTDIRALEVVQSRFFYNTVWPGGRIFMNKGTKITLLSVGALTVIGLGVGGGILIHDLYFGPSRDYDNLVVNGMDRGVLMDEYDSISENPNVDYTKEFTPAEAANVAYTLFQSNEYFATRGIGVADASIVEQEIFSTQIRAGDSYFEESNSKSAFVNVAFRMYEEGDSTMQYRGVVGEDLQDGIFASEGTTYSNEDYAEMMGRNVHSVETYVINEDTVIDTDKTADMYGTTSFKKVEDGYSLELELDPYTSVVYYVRQMKTISNLAEEPYFYYVHLSFSLDENLELKTMTSYEKYYAKLSSGIGSNTTGALTTTFYSDYKAEIPVLNAPSF